MSPGRPARAEAVKSGCSSFLSPTSLMASSAKLPLLGATRLEPGETLPHVFDPCS